MHNFQMNIINNYLPLRDVVFYTLRQAILKGELKPGERLMEMQLANQLGVSRTPIREAIRKLELEGLVLMIPRRGAVVAKITEKDLRDVLEVRTSLEKLDGTNEEKLQHLRESIAVQEQILRYGEDSEVRGATLYNICFTYWKVGEYDKALEQARKLPNLYKARENALVYFLRGEEKHKVAREALTPIAWVIAHHMTALYETENDPSYLTKAEKILDILFASETENNFIKSIRERIRKRVAQ